MQSCRIVPILNDIGLFGDKIQQAFAEMGVLEFADADIDAAMADDERIAEEPSGPETGAVLSGPGCSVAPATVTMLSGWPGE